MNVAKPIKPEEYQKFREEMYNMSGGTEVSLTAAVGLDEDPSINPKGITEKLAQVQAYKNRVLVVLNRCVRCKSYWSTVHGRISSKYEAAITVALLSEESRKGKNADERKAIASAAAGPVIVDKFFKGEGEFDDHFHRISRDLQDAIAFLSEVRNIYDNLDDTSRNLAVQLKSVQVNMKAYGDPTNMTPRQEATIR